MSCSRRRRNESISDEVESIRREEEEVDSELESFRESKCFLVVWRDSAGRRRCKCCCRHRCSS